jgi:ketosteroid isomerase-like protein
VILSVGLTVAAADLRVFAQRAAEAIPESLSTMVDTERAFAARALVIGWKAAFLEYFADDAIGFEGTTAGLAREQIRRRPDPPSDLKLIWEPRYGDIAASGELGYLTGPVQNILPSRDGGKPVPSLYASIWERQRDGAFRVVLDVGTPTPRPVPFAAGFTRAPHADRFDGRVAKQMPTLSAADSVLNSGLRTSQTRAYRDHLATGARLYRRNRMPAIGERAILAAVAGQPTYSEIDLRYSQSAASGDLGYTWGTYVVGSRRKPVEFGFYVRVWVRADDGQWKVALDSLQPQ